MVSSDFGQLAVSRHLTSGVDWAMAGAASAETAMPAAPTLRSSRRFMDMFPPCQRPGGGDRPAMAGSRFAPAFTRFAVRYGAGRCVRKRKPPHSRSHAVPAENPERTDCAPRGMGTPPAPAYVLSVP